MPALRLTVSLILRWADAHRQRAGRWPPARSGPVAGAPGQTWGAVNRALARGGRGLPGGSSLARLLGEKRGRHNQAQAPPLDAGQILLWADAHFRRTGPCTRATATCPAARRWRGCCAVTAGAERRRRRLLAGRRVTGGRSRER